MDRIYLVTGGCGHLGNTIVKKLLALGRRVRALALPGESLAALADCPGVELYRGDVCERSGLEPFFEHDSGEEAVLIHTAALISIQSKISPRLWEVNVGGVENIIDACLAHGVRMVHVSSVHALPEQPGRGVIRETEQFCPQWVKGAYAKTKAEGAQRVLDAVRWRGLDATIVLPAGILGPGDFGRNHLNQTIRSCVTGKLHTLVQGGYDLVDVRDVADACIDAVDKGAKGETYILSGRHYEWREIAAILRSEETGADVRHFFSPTALKSIAPFLELHAKVWKRPPLFTGYSLYCMTANDNFSARRARESLGFVTRPIRETVRDTAVWELARHTDEVRTHLAAKLSKPGRKLKKAPAMG